MAPLGCTSNHFRQYKLFIYTLAGSLQGSFTPIDDTGFGIRCVAWHPTGAYLAIGGWDDKVGRIIAVHEFPDETIVRSIS